MMPRIEFGLTVVRGAGLNVFFAGQVDGVTHRHAQVAKDGAGGAAFATIDCAISSATTCVG